MTNLFIYSFIVYGTCNILIWGSNFNWWRNLLGKLGKGDYSLYKLFTCFMCFDNIAIILLLDGVFSSGIVWCINTVQEYLENKTND